MQVHACVFFGNACRMHACMIRAMLNIQDPSGMASPHHPDALRVVEELSGTSWSRGRGLLVLGDTGCRMAEGRLQCGFCGILVLAVGRSTGFQIHRKRIRGSSPTAGVSRVAGVLSVSSIIRPAAEPAGQAPA